MGAETITIPEEILEAVIAHAQEGFPLEVCGILGGKGATVASHYPMTNSDASNEHFSLEPREQFAVMRSLRASGEGMLAIYHSHPDTPARPSEEDIRLAATPAVCHLIVSLRDPQTPVVKAFRIADGTVEPVAIRTK